MLKLADKEFKITITNMFLKLKDKVFKKWVKMWRTSSELKFIKKIIKWIIQK